MRRTIWWVLCGLALAWLCIVAWKWPYTRSAVVTGLSHNMGRPVQIGAFHPTFFPLGFVAYDVRFIKTDPHHGPSTVTIHKAVVVASHLDTFLNRKRLKRILIVGLHVTIPSGPSTSEGKRSSSRHGPPKFTFIGQIDMQDSSIEFPSSDTDTSPFKVMVKAATLDNVNLHSPSAFHVELVTNEPQGVIRSTGQLGPWNWDDAGRTLLTGSFTFNQADLSTVGDVKGLLNAQGKFNGLLGHVICNGRIEVPQFGTTNGSHVLPLSTTFQATVNGLNGDTVLNDVESRLNRTIIKVQGEIKGDGQQPGKTARLHLSVDEGRVDDLLLLFTRSEQPSMTGTINLQADVDLPPGDPNFLKKLELRGDFGMSDSRFTKGSTQAPINHLSESAEGMSKSEEKQDPNTVLSDIKGHVSAHNGIASLSHVSFIIPGADANMSGTYNLLDKAVHLEGTLRTTGEISDTTSGLKAGFLKLLSPFLKKHSVTVVPFKITGTAQHSTLSLDLARKKRF